MNEKWKIADAAVRSIMAGIDIASDLLGRNFSFADHPGIGDAIAIAAAECCMVDPEHYDAIGAVGIANEDHLGEGAGVYEVAVTTAIATHVP